MRLGMLRSILDELARVCRDIDASWISSTDGLILASRGEEESNEDRFGILGAELAVLGRQTAADLAGSDLGEVSVKGGKGMLVVMPAGSELILAALTASDDGTAVIQEMQRAADRIAALFREPEARVSP